MHVHIVLLLWCENGIIYQQVIRMLVSYHKSLLVYKVSYIGKRVGQTCMFTLFFVVVRKGYCLPTSYQNVGVVSVIPTCLQSFMYLSILVRELHKDAYSHCCLLWCEKGIVYQQVIRMLVSYH